MIIDTFSFTKFSGNINWSPWLRLNIWRDNWDKLSFWSLYGSWMTQTCIYMSVFSAWVIHLVILMIKNIPRCRVWSCLSLILHGSKSLDEDWCQNMAMACDWFIPSSVHLAAFMIRLIIWTGVLVQQGWSFMHLHGSCLLLRSRRKPDVKLEPQAEFYPMVKWIYHPFKLGN